MNTEIKAYSQIAERMWEAYSAQAGGKTYDNKPLPTWVQLGDQRQACWCAAAMAALSCLS